MKISHPCKKDPTLWNTLVDLVDSKMTATLNALGCRSIHHSQRSSGHHERLSIPESPHHSGFPCLHHLRKQIPTFSAIVTFFHLPSMAISHTIDSTYGIRFQRGSASTKVTTTISPTFLFLSSSDFLLIILPYSFKFGTMSASDNSPTPPIAYRPK